MTKIAVLLSGRGSNFIAINESVKKGTINAEIVAVISDKQDAKGLDYAKENGLNSFFVNPTEYNNREDFDKAVIKILQDKSVELVCLAGFMRLISPYFVETFRNRIINIHPTLLPSFPGLHVHEKAIEYGVKFSGCTVHFVDEKTDNGPIIMQAVVPVLDDDNADTLAERILKEEHKIYSEAIQLFCDNKLKIQGRRVVRL